MVEKLVLHLRHKETGEEETFRLKTSPIAAAKALNKLMKYQEEGWRLFQVDGEGQIAAFLRNQIEDFEADPEKFGGIRKTLSRTGEAMKLGAKDTGSSMRDIYGQAKTILKKVKKKGKLK